MSKRWYEKRVVPERYAYHITFDCYRESILKNGLIPKSCAESRWGFKNDDDQYPAMVFANNTDLVDYFFYFDDYYESFDSDRWDIWQIDTEVYKGEWFIDLNTCKSGVHICTAHDIPTEALTLLRIVNGTCSFCGCIDFGQTASRILMPENSGEYFKAESLLPCCYNEFAEAETTQKYYQIEDFVERHGWYRSR
jgi:hypothetical protein